MTTTTITTTITEALDTLPDGSRISAHSSATGMWEVLRDDQRIGWLTEQKFGRLAFSMKGQRWEYFGGIKRTVEQLTHDLSDFGYV